MIEWDATLMIFLKLKELSGYLWVYRRLAMENFKCLLLSVFEIN